MRAIDRAIAWCTRRGISVAFEDRHIFDSEYDATRSAIIVGRGSARTRLHVLLHECGHALIGTDGYGRGKASTLEEEFDAWRRGGRLAARLGIRIDAEAYARTRGRCIGSYVRALASAGSRPRDTTT